MSELVRPFRSYSVYAMPCIDCKKEIEGRDPTKIPLRCPSCEKKHQDSLSYAKKKSKEINDRIMKMPPSHRVRG